jgi:hypothetical protein
MKSKALKEYVQKGDLANVVDYDDALLAMDKYLEAKLEEFRLYYNKLAEEHAIHCGISKEQITEFLTK